MGAKQSKYGRMVVKKKGAQKTFQEEAHMQGGTTVPVKPKRAYGTGLPEKKAPLTKSKMKIKTRG